MGGDEKRALVKSVDGPEAVGRRRMLLSRLKGAKAFELVLCGCSWKVGMPESWCCRGIRCCGCCGSMVDLWLALAEGRDSNKECMEPRRRCAGVAEDTDDMRRRVFWRVKLPATAPNAREKELACECCERPSAAMVASLTASNMLVSLMSCW